MKTKIKQITLCVLLYIILILLIFMQPNYTEYENNLNILQNQIEYLDCIIKKQDMFIEGRAQIIYHNEHYKDINENYEKGWDDCEKKLKKEETEVINAIKILKRVISEDNK